MKWQKMVTGELRLAKDEEQEEKGNGEVQEMRRRKGKEGERGQLHRGFTEERRKETRISYKALLSGWVAEVAIVLRFDSARWTWLTFNRCVFANVDDDDKEDESESDSPMGTTTSWLYRSTLTIFYCCRLFLRFCLSSPECFFVSTEKFRSSSRLFSLHCVHCIHRIISLQILSKSNVMLMQ